MPGATGSERAAAGCPPADGHDRTETVAVSRARPAILTAVVVAVALVVAYAVGSHSGAGRPAKLRTPDLRAIPAPRHGPAIPAHGAYFGAWVRQGAFTQPNQVAALDTLQGELGRRLDIVHTYLTWQGGFPTESDEVALSQGSCRAQMRSCGKGHYTLPVHMIKLSQTREIPPYVWASG